MADKAGSPTLGTGSFNLGVDISTPAVVAWATSDTTLEVTFDARRLDSTDAFFKLRRTVTLKTAPSTKTPLFVFIPPEQIDRLELVECATAEPSGASSHDDEARKKLGSDLVCLRFSLRKPVALIGPEDLDLTPKNKASGVILDSLRSLAHHDGLTVYFARNVASQARLKSLCEAASNGSLRSILRQADLTSLYRGKGGHVIITETDAPVAASNQPDSPPSYDELGPGPPPAPLYESGGETSSAFMLHSTTLLQSTDTYY